MARYRIDGKIYEAATPEEAYAMRDAELAAAAPPQELRSEPITRGESLAAGGLTGATLGWKDEMRAGVGAGLDAIFGGGDLSDQYGRLLAAYRQDEAALRDANPGTYLMGEILGGVAVPAPGVGQIRTAAALGGRALSGALAKQGATMGAAAGAGYSEAPTLGGVAADTALGVGAGAALAPAAGLATAGLARAGQWGLDAIRARLASRNPAAAAQAGAGGAGMAPPVAPVSPQAPLGPTAGPGTATYADAVRLLRESGVPLSAGQATGTNWLKAMETTLSESPFGGALQRQGERQREILQRAMLARVGHPDAANSSGLINRETLGQAEAALGAQYKAGLQGQRVSLADDAFLNDLGEIEARHVELLPFEQKAQVRQIIGNLLDEAANSGEIAGEVYQRLRSRMGQLSRGVQRPELAALYGDLQRALDAAFERGAPSMKPTNRQYAGLHALQDIYDRMTGPGAVEGYLNPLTIARRVNDSPAESALGDLTRAAAMVLPDRLGNSGTAQRQAMLEAGRAVRAAVVPALAGTAAVNPTAAAVAGLGVAAPMVASSVLARAPQAARTAALGATRAPMLVSSAGRAGAMLEPTTRAPRRRRRRK